MTLDYDEEQALKHVKALAASARSALAEAKGIKEAAGAGKAKEIKPYPEVPRLERSAYGGSNYVPSPEQCRKQVAEWFKLCEPIHSENQEAVRHNASLVALAVAYFHSLGLEDEEVEWSGFGSRRKARRLPAGWLTSVRLQLGRADPWQSVLDTKSRLEADITSREKQQAEAERTKAAQAAAEEKKRKAYAVMGALCGRYGVEPESEMSVLLDAIIQKNKYLWLAHYLAKNRSDWIDGTAYAETGLDGFTVVTARDKEVAADIGGHIANWDGDGRIFRDCAWNYEALLGIVAAEAAELYADYLKVKGFVSE